MKLYLAGPMSGIPQFNYPMFFAVTEKLRAAGHEVLNPAEMDSPEMQEKAMQSQEGNLIDLGDTLTSWGDILAKDVKIVADEVDGVCLLPGWQRSRGARMEAFVGLTVQKKVYLYDRDVLLVPAPAHLLMQIISNNTVNQGDVSRYYENPNA